MAKVVKATFRGIQKKNALMDTWAVCQLDHMRYGEEMDFLREEKIDVVFYYATYGCLKAEF